MIHEVRRVPHCRRNRHERAQHGAVNGGDEEVHDRGSVSGAALTPVYDAPPEQSGSAEEAEMLEHVDAFVCERRVVERRHVPDPERHAVEHERGRRRRHQAPENCQWRPLNSGDKRLPDAGRQRPQDADQRSADRHQRCRDDHQQLVLHHVRSQPALAPFVHRRQQRHHERQPPGRARNGFTRPNAPSEPGIPPEAGRAGGVETEEHDEASDKHRAPSEESLPRLSGVRTTRTTRGRARP